MVSRSLFLLCLFFFFFPISANGRALLATILLFRCAACPLDRLPARSSDHPRSVRIFSKASQRRPWSLAVVFERMFAPFAPDERHKKT